MSILQRYNGLDTIATYQLWSVFHTKLAADPIAHATYEQTRSLQGPAFYAMLRGILVDTEAVTRLRETLEVENRRILKVLDAITLSLGLGVINLASPVQVKWLFSCFGAHPESSNREAMEQLSKADPELAPVCNLILHWRDRAKMLTVLQPGLTDPDSRMRTYYKLTGTETGRWSSAQNALNTRNWPTTSGMNMQNIKRDESSDRASIRSIFTADAGMKFANIDLERADAWIVALEVFAATGDTSYLEAVESFDLHTRVSMLTWTDREWPAEPAAAIAKAKEFFYRQYDYRFMAKKLGHGTNYLGKPWTLSRQMKIPLPLAEAAQAAYFAAFPGIRRWHLAKARQLQTTGTLTNLLGRTRRFHQRLDSDATLREAIAFLGQSGTADVLNRAILRLWASQTAGTPIEFLAQVHDSVLLQYPEDRADEAAEAITHAFAIPVTATHAGRVITKTIPVEVAIGWNWSGATDRNPDGLKKKAPMHDQRLRLVAAPGAKAKPSVMDRRICSIY